MKVVFVEINNHKSYQAVAHEGREWSRTEYLIIWCNLSQLQFFNDLIVEIPFTLVWNQLFHQTKL